MRTGVVGTTAEGQGADELPRGERLGRLPVIAIVGRPNTGKSTLFNRLTRSQRAVVASTPGVTRDRHLAIAEHDRRRFLVVDTGGFEVDEPEELSQAVRAQSLLATEAADAIILLLDGRAGINPLDASFVERLRRVPTPLFVAVNKIDTPKQHDLESDFFELGVDKVYPISAEHGLNIETLLTDVIKSVPSLESAAESPQPTAAVTIVGRPNVGKSSLLNRLVGYQRMIVSALPGTTRDAVDTTVTRGNKRYLLVDTAGVRRRPKVRSLIERASVVRALGSLERAEVALLVVDATEGLTDQDARLASYVWERGRALVLIVNKWDAVPHEMRHRRSVAREIAQQFPALANVTILCVSALTGHGVGAIWGAIDAALASHRLRIPTRKLNVLIERAVAQQPPASVKGKRPRLLYATQTAASPPTISIFTTNPAAVQLAYERYLTNQIRAEFGCQGTPIRLRFRSRRPERTRK